MHNNKIKINNRIVEVKCNGNRRKKICLIELLGKYIRNIVPWMSVETLLETFLIHVMANESDTAAQHKQ